MSMSVYVYVCPRGYFRNHTCHLYQVFVHVDYGRGSILRRRRCDALCRPTPLQLTPIFKVKLNWLLTTELVKEFLQKATSQGRIFHGGQRSVTSIVGSIAVGCSSPAVVPLLKIQWSFLLQTPQQRFPKISNGPKTPENAPSRGNLDPI